MVGADFKPAPTLVVIGVFLFNGSVAAGDILRPVAKEERQEPRGKGIRGLVKPNWSVVWAKFQGQTHTAVINTCTVCLLTGDRSIGMAHINPGTTLAILDEEWRTNRRMLTPAEAKGILLKEAFRGMFPVLTNERWNRILILSRTNVGKILAERKRKALAGYMRQRKGKSGKRRSVEELVADYMVTAQDIENFLRARLGEAGKRVDIRGGEYDCGLSGAAVILRSDDVAEYRPHLTEYLQNKSNAAAYFDLAGSKFDLLYPGLPARLAKPDKGLSIPLSGQMVKEDQGIKEAEALMALKRFNEARSGCL